VNRPARWRPPPIFVGPKVGNASGLATRNCQLCGLNLSPVFLFFIPFIPSIQAEKFLRRRTLILTEPTIFEWLVRAINLSLDGGDKADKKDDSWGAAQLGDEQIFVRAVSRPCDCSVPEAVSRQLLGKGNR
jgi:hypothetical protein